MAVTTLLNGRQEPGRSALFWVAFAVLVVAAAVLPPYVGRYTLLNLNNFLLITFLAAGLALLWGFCGILSLGQSAFFGLGGYAYGIVAINLAGTNGASLVGLLGGLVIVGIVAALLGWLMFYGRVRGVFVA